MVSHCLGQSVDTKISDGVAAHYASSLCWIMSCLSELKRSSRSPGAMTGVQVEVNREWGKRFVDLDALPCVS